MTLTERLRAAIQPSECLTSVVPNDLLSEAAIAVAMWDVALVTLGQIEQTPRNAGARRNARATLRFIETQCAQYRNEAAVERAEAA